MSVLIILAISIYLLTCVGFYRSAFSDSSIVDSLSEYPIKAQQFGVGIIAIFWPIVVTIGFLIKGITK